MTSGLRFGLLGALEVSRDDTVLPVARGTLRVLLATLLLEGNRTVPSERIIDRLWDDDPPPSARSSVHTYAMRLRRLLGDDGARMIQTRPNGYAIDVDPDRVDVLVFDDLLRRARQADQAGDPATEADLLTEALRLWRGPALLDVPSASLQRTVVPRLAEERLQAQERRLHLHLLLGRHDGLVGELTGLTEEHPLRESVWLLLMRTLCRLGRPVEALDAYRRVRGLLRAELGIEPSAPLRHLHRQILAGSHDAAPAAPGPVATNHRTAAAPTAAPNGAGQPRRTPAPDPPARLVIPSQLPMDAGTFAGRTEHLERLRRELTAPATASAVPVLLLTGAPGVGKSALAVHVAHQVRASFPDGQLYANLRGYSADPPLPPEVVLGRFLRALGVPANQMPTEQDDQVNLYRSLLADRRVLVVLDNAAEPRQVRPLLPNQPGCAALVTSRDDLRGLVALDNARQISLAPLTTEESRAVLAAMLDPDRVAAEPEAVDELAVRCGRLPLALRIAAANLQAYPHLSIAEYADALRVRGRLVQLRVRGDAEAAVRAAFDLSYARLDAPAARLFRLLSLVPGPDFAAPAAAALLDCPLTEAERLLDALLAANLVFPSAPGRYQLHDLIREYAALRAAEDPDAEAARTRLWHHYLRTARAATRLLYPDVPRLPLADPAADDPRRGPGRTAGDAPSTGEAAELDGEAAALAWLDGERANLVAAVLTAHDRDRRRFAWRLADALRGYFSGRGHAVEGLAMAEAALVAARAEGDRAAEAAMLDLRGQIHFVLSRYEIARDCHEEALKISRDIGDLAGQASSLHHLGRVSAQLGPPERCHRYHREALELARSTGDLDAQALSTNYVGVAHLNAGRLDQALEWHLRALDLCHRAGNRSILARVVGGLANLAWYRGDLRIAIALYRECLDMVRRLGNRYLEANALVCLAEARCDAGEYAQAIADAEAAVRLGRETGERRHEVGGAEVSATARLRAGRPDGVIEDYRAALRLAREINFRYGEISILTALATAHRLGGDPARAVGYAEEALRVTAESGVRGVQPRTLTELAHGCLDLGEPDRAAARLAEALRLARRAGQRLTEARALHVLGLVRRPTDAAAARRCWRAAAEILTQVGAPEAEAVRALLREIDHQSQPLFHLHR